MAHFSCVVRKEQKNSIISENIFSERGEVKIVLEEENKRICG
jgi:hypothetical protein